jgi:large subunit ribosomal protein L25
MGDKIALSVEERKVLGKKVKQLRKQGKIPAIVYGQDFESTPVMVDTMVATKAWRDAGKHHVIELTVAGRTRLAMIKSADFVPVKHTLRHLSLHVVKQNEKVETEIPVRVSGEGETPAEKAGMVVLQTIEAVQVSALPNDLPDAVEVPGDKLVEAGDHVTVADIKPITGVTILAEPERIVATVYEPSALAAANDAAGGDATEETEVEAENGAEETPAEGEETKEEKK